MQSSELVCAVVQMVSGPQWEENRQQAESLLQQAVAQGAQWVLLPENFAFMGLQDADKLALAEEEGQGPIQTWLTEQAKGLGIWLLGGSIPLRAPHGRCTASLLGLDPTGRIRARYDKIHLFDVSLADGESYCESKTIAPGLNPVTLDSPWGQWGLSICYDLRFPELYRSYAGANFLAVPSAFTRQTGQAHWEVLLRARAIENQCFVLAANQGGRHANGRETWGHSMIIDPWGQVLAHWETGPGLALANCSLTQLQQVRTSIPALQHR